MSKSKSEATASPVKGATLRKRIWLSVIGLITVLVYIHVYKSDFFLDDYLHLHLVDKIDNPLTPYFTNLFMGAFFRPGVFIFWKINHALFNLNAAGYYATNVVFLLGTLYFLFKVLMDLTGNRNFAGWATLLFAASPVTGVGVIWLSNRFDLIGTFFYLLALFLFMRYARHADRRYYIGAVASGVFSYFCKEMMITLPAVMVVATAFMFYYRDRLPWDRLKQILILSTPFFTLGILFILWRYGIIHSLGGYSGEIKVKLSAPYIFQLFSSFADYFWLMRFRTLFAIYLVLFVILLAKKDFLANNPLSLFGLSIAFLTFIPLILVLRLQAVMTYMTPRFFFLPSIGMTILLASTYDPKSGRIRKFLASSFLIFTTLFFAFNTFAMINVWVDERQNNTEVMEQLAGYLTERESENKIEQGQIYYVAVSGTEVALDAGLKIRHPEFKDKAYFLNPAGPTQVIGTTTLYNAVGKDLNWPNTFELNPCTYKELSYGLVDVSPHQIMDRMAKSEDVLVVTKTKIGKLVAADRDNVRSLLASRGVLQ